MDSPYYAEVLIFSLALALAFGWGLATIRRCYRHRTPICRDDDGVWRAARYPKGTRP